MEFHYILCRYKKDRECCKQLHIHTFEEVNGVDQFLKTASHKIYSV